MNFILRCLSTLVLISFSISIKACVHGVVPKSEELNPPEKEVLIFKSERLVKKKCIEGYEITDKLIAVSGRKRYWFPGVTSRIEEGSYRASLNIARREAVSQGASAILLLEIGSNDNGDFSIPYKIVKCQLK